MSSLRPVSGTAPEVLSLLREWDAAVAPEPLVIATSGSTGQPKRVVLSREAMRVSAAATHARLGGPGQWVLNLPPTYVAGVQVLFRSVVAGLEPLLDGARPGGGRTYLSLVPTQLFRRLADGGSVDDLARHDAVLVGGGPLAPEVRTEAEGRGIRVAQTYGMSETCGGCVYDGQPLDGVELRIGDDDEVLVRGPVLFDGYEGDPARTARAMRGGWLHTGDTGLVADDGRLRVTGRLDDVIISGGVKVPAPAVEQMLVAHPGVTSAFVVGVPDPEWGQRVVAIVATNGPEPALEELRDLVTPRAWAPRSHLVVRELPLLGTGKPDRVALRRLALDG